jgi:hypothetical protein
MSLEDDIGHVAAPNVLAYVDLSNQLSTKQDAFIALDKLLADPDAVGSLILRNCKLGDAGMVRLVQLMQTTQSLTHLDLSGCFTSARHEVQVRELSLGIANNDSISYLSLRDCVFTAKSAALLEAGLQDNRWLTKLSMDNGEHTAALKRHVTITAKVHGCVWRAQVGGEIVDDQLNELMLECGRLGKVSLIPTMLELGADAGFMDGNGTSIHAILFGCKPDSATQEALMAAYREKFVLDAAVIAAVELNGRMNLLKEVVLELAGEQWTERDGTARSVLQCIVDCCLNKEVRQGGLADKVAVVLAAGAVAVLGPDWVHDADANGRTVPATAALCFNNPDLQKLLGVVVYGRFALLAADEPLSSSDSVLVHRCADVAHCGTQACYDINNVDVNVVTMFRDELAWRERLDMLQRLGKIPKGPSERDIVRVASKHRITGPLQVGPEVWLYTRPKQEHRASVPAIILMEQYPFAVVVKGQTAATRLASDSHSTSVPTTPPRPSKRQCTGTISPQSNTRPPDAPSWSEGDVADSFTNPTPIVPPTNPFGDYPDELSLISLTVTDDPIPTRRKQNYRESSAFRFRKKTARLKEKFRGAVRWVKNKTSSKRKVHREVNFNTDPAGGTTTSV